MSKQNATTRIDPRQRRFLGLAEQLEEHGPPKLASLAISLTAILLMAGVFWASVTNIDEASVAEGTVVPSGNIQIVQHLDGGIIQEIHARKGEHVEKGQALLHLDGGATQAELSKALAREAALSLQAERLKAFAEEREPNFDLIAADYPDLIADQRAIYDLQVKNRTYQRSVLEQQIAERTIDYQTLTEQVENLKKQIALASEATEMRKTLYNKGLATKPAWLDAQRDLTQAQSNLLNATGSVLQAKERADEARQRLRETTSRLANEAMSQMGTVTAELAELRETIRVHNQRVKRLIVRAPVTGTVKELSIAGIGEVIAPGGKVAEIVPADDPLVIEAKLKPGDIGNLQVGLPALIKVSAYDFARFGGIEGEVTHISASTFEDQQTGDTYYKATIKLNQHHVGADPLRNVIRPGMTVQANINSGERTVIEYLTKPVRNTLADALHEP